MPIYEYTCRACQERFEAIVLSSTSEVTCPSCNGGDLEKMFSAFAVGGVEKAVDRNGACGSCGDRRGPGACGLPD